MGKQRSVPAVGLATALEERPAQGRPEMTFDNTASDWGSPSHPSPSLPMGRMIEMAFTGLWVIRCQGALVEIGGRLCWPDRGALEQAAAEAGIPLSDIVVHTGRLAAGNR